MGARPLRRAIQRLIEDPLADEVLGKTLPAGGTMVVDRDSDQVKMTAKEAPPDEREAVGAAAGPGEESAGAESGES